MLKGFNSDILIKGKKYHVQTEDWGRNKSFFLSQIFFNGQLIKSIKVPYSSFLDSSNIKSNDQSTVRFALYFQHNKILDQLASGKIIS